MQTRSDDHGFTGNFLYNSGGSFEGHTKVTAYQQYRAKSHGFAISKISIGDQATEYWHGIHQGSVTPIYQCRFPVSKKHMFDEKEHQQRAHTVVAEALPHLCKEKYDQSPWMTKKLFGRVCRCCVSQGLLALVLIG